MTYAEYLAAEEHAAEKHDFLDGEVFGMSGGTLKHSVLSATCSSLLRAALASRGCMVFESNARVRRVEARFSCYPDVTVVCGPVQRAVDDDEAIANPTLIVEVLSGSTEAYDRGEKARQYTRMDSLRHARTRGGVCRRGGPRRHGATADGSMSHQLPSARSFGSSSAPTETRWSACTWLPTAASMRRTWW